MRNQRKPRDTGEPRGNLEIQKNLEKTQRYRRTQRFRRTIDLNLDFAILETIIYAKNGFECNHTRSSPNGPNFGKKVKKSIFHKFKFFVFKGTHHCTFTIPQIQRHFIECMSDSPLSAIMGRISESMQKFSEINTF